MILSQKLKKKKKRAPLNIGTLMKLFCFNYFISGKKNHKFNSM